jgi:hypothetical protein
MATENRILSGAKQLAEQAALPATRAERDPGSGERAAARLDPRGKAVITPRGFRLYL